MCSFVYNKTHPPNNTREVACLRAIFYFFFSFTFYLDPCLRKLFFATIKGHQGADDNTLQYLAIMAC